MFKSLVSECFRIADDVPLHVLFNIYGTLFCRFLYRVFTCHYIDSIERKLLLFIPLLLLRCIWILLFKFACKRHVINSHRRTFWWHHGWLFVVGFWFDTVVFYHFAYTGHYFQWWASQRRRNYIFFIRFRKHIALIQTHIRILFQLTLWIESIHFLIQCKVLAVGLSMLVLATKAKRRQWFLQILVILGWVHWMRYIICLSFTSFEHTCSVWVAIVVSLCLILSRVHICWSAKWSFWLGCDVPFFFSVDVVVCNNIVTTTFATNRFSF